VPRWRRWLGVACLGLVAILVLLTALPVIETNEWWVRLWDYPRVQIAGLLAIALAGLAAAGPCRGRVFWIATAAGLAALAWQLAQVARYLPGWPVEVAGSESCEAGKRLRLLNANVLLPNKDHGALLRLVRRTDPDVILLLEPGQAWERAVRSLSAVYPHQVSLPLPNTYGIMLLSKFPLEDVKVRNLLQPHVPSVTAGLRLPSGDLVHFYGVHPEPPYPGDDSGERDAELVMVGREIRAAGHAAVVMGDLNDVAWSHTSRLFRRLSGTLDPRVGRGPFPTFPADRPILSWPLDHIFVTPHFELVAIDRLPDIGSDHRPMFYALCLARASGRRLQPPLSEETREDARDQVEEGREELAEEERG
jgi:endonuclease/exonuclease/phosphatase (EEP) superfamily protein YafD